MSYTNEKKKNPSMKDLMNFVEEKAKISSFLLNH